MPALQVCQDLRQQNSSSCVLPPLKAKRLFFPPGSRSNASFVRSSPRGHFLLYIRRSRQNTVWHLRHDLSHLMHLLLLRTPAISPRMNSGGKHGINECQRRKFRSSGGGLRVSVENRFIYRDAQRAGDDAGMIREGRRIWEKGDSIDDVRKEGRRSRNTPDLWTNST